MLRPWIRGGEHLKTASAALSPEFLDLGPGTSREANFISASSFSYPVAGVRRHEQSLLRQEAGAGRRDAIRLVRAAAAEVRSTSERV